MGINIAGYVEKKLEDGSWELVTNNPVSSRLKYIIEDYNELPRLNWEDLSKGLQEHYAKDENGQVYASFYTTTVKELEDRISLETRSIFTEVNTIVKALGACRMYSDEGEEIDAWDSNEKEKLTYPVNKTLIDDLQYAFSKIRNIGQREAFDLFVNEHTEWDGEYRIVFAAT